MDKSRQEQLRVRINGLIKRHPFDDWPDASGNILGVIKVQVEEGKLDVESGKFMLEQFNEKASKIGKEVTWEQCLSGNY